MAGRYVP